MRDLKDNPTYSYCIGYKQFKTQCSNCNKYVENYLDDDLTPVNWVTDNLQWSTAKKCREYRRLKVKKKEQDNG